MSRARKIADAERTAIILDLIGAGRFPLPDEAMPPASVVLEEVAPHTGWVKRLADVLVLGVWQASGQRLDGYEVKASRADLRKELADLTKHQAVARYCDTWTLVAWDDAVLQDAGTIPDSWGITITHEVNGERELLVKRKPAKRLPDPWPRGFVCSMVRNAYQQSPGAEFVGRACADAYAKGMKAGRDWEVHEWRELLNAVCTHLYGENRSAWPRDLVWNVTPEKARKVLHDHFEQLPLHAASR